MALTPAPIAMSRWSTQPPGSQNLVGLLQASPHFVQLEVVPSGVTQPCSGVVHLPQPLLHVGLHLPPPQLVPEAFVVAQTVLQAPQLFLSADTSFSQPFRRLLSQSSKRPLQTGWQALPVQLLLDTCAAAAVLQTFLQPPQLLALVAVSTSQPLVALLSQSPYVPEHCGAQALFIQLLAVTWAAAAVLQTVPQAPQLLASVELSASQPLSLLLSQVR
jgi:hypothetical protein